MTGMEVNLDRPMLYSLEGLAVDGYTASFPSLYKMTRLVELSLLDLSTTFPTFLEDITLLQLCKFTVHWSHDQISRLFRHVNSPALVSVDLIRYDSEPDLMLIFGAAFDRLFRPPYDHKFSFKYIDHGRLLWGFQLEGHRRFLCVHTYFSSVHLMDRELAIEYLTPLLNYLQPMTESITTLNIHVSKSPSKRLCKQPIVTQFGAFTNVTDVHVDCHRLQDLLKTPEVSPEFLPAARALYIHGHADPKTIECTSSSQGSRRPSRHERCMRSAYRSVW